MLLDSPWGLSQLHERFKAFLVSPSIEAAFDAAVAGDPAPYDELLNGLRVRKRSEATELHISMDRWLELSAPIEELQRFCDELLVQDDHDHHHWRSRPLSLIIEADEWRTGQHQV